MRTFAEFTGQKDTALLLNELDKNGLNALHLVDIVLREFEAKGVDIQPVVDAMTEYLEDNGYANSIGAFGGRVAGNVANFATNLFRGAQQGFNQTQPAKQAPQPDPRQQGEMLIRQLSGVLQSMGLTRMYQTTLQQILSGIRSSAPSTIPPAQADDRQPPPVMQPQAT